MKTISLTLYTFDELSDKAKERARSWWRQFSEYSWTNESIDSIRTFCAHFGVELTNFEVDSWRYHFKADAENSHFRGVKLRDFKRDHMPTGYCLDCALWQTFYDVFKNTGDAKHAFNTALDAGFSEWKSDLEHQESNEFIDEEMTINEYTFLENGQRFDA